MQVRFCMADVAAFFHARHVGVTIVTSGPMAPVIDLFLDILHGTNVTIHRESTGMGTLVDRSSLIYNGCLGSLQRNESDMMAGEVPMPVPGPGLKHAVIFGFEWMGILSGYRMTDASNSATHVLDMFLQFSVDYWCLTAAFFFMLFLLLAIALPTPRIRCTRRSFWCIIKASLLRNEAGKQEREDRIKRAEQVITACLLNQHSSCPSLLFPTFAPRILYTSCCLLAFYAAYYLTSMIQTNMVVTEAPATVQTYADILKMDKNPLWFAALPDKDDFAFAASDSMEARIWQRALTIGLNQSLIGNSMSEIAGKAMEAVKMTSVLLIRRLLGPVVRHVICSGTRSRDIYTDIYPIYRHDSSAKQRLQVSMQNARMESRASAYVRHRIMLAFQGGLKEKAISLFDFSPLLTFTSQESDRKFTVITQCNCNRVLIPETVFSAVVPFHFVSLFALSILLFLLNLLILTWEQRSGHHQGSRLRERPGKRIRFRSL